MVLTGEKGNTDSPRQQARRERPAAGVRGGSFTLIELPAVSAIIASLAALLLLPVWAKAKGQAQKIQSVNNLRQIVRGIGREASDE